jgi:hypothetical protein
MSSMMTRPIQNAEKLPATKPERMFSEAPPCLEQLVTSFTWRELVLVKILVNSGISAPATVPQLMMVESTHQRFGHAMPASEVAQQQLAGDEGDADGDGGGDPDEVGQRRSKSKSFLPPNLALLMPRSRSRTPARSRSSGRA